MVVKKTENHYVIDGESAKRLAAALTTNRQEKQGLTNGYTNRST